MKVAALVFILGAITMTQARAEALLLPDEPTFTAIGKIIYDSQCASCHGANLQGEPDWRVRKPNGRMPAPPHDASGHTWHHPDRQLFETTKYGLQRFAGPGYQSDMPAYEKILTDAEIIAVLSYIKNMWYKEHVADRHSRTARRHEHPAITAWLFDILEVATLFS